MEQHVLSGSTLSAEQLGPLADLRSVAARGMHPAQRDAVPGETSSAGRTASWAALLALTVAGMMPAAASATVTATDKGEGVPPGTAPQPEQDKDVPAKEVHHFNIPAGSVADVMQAIGKVAGIQIELASQEQMANVSSPGVQGVVTVEQALAQALQPTGFAARFVSPESVKIEMRSNHESVVVTSDALPGIKFTAPLVDLPQTVTVVSQDMMQYTASTTLVDALRTIPGITFGAGEGGNPLGDRPFIRGLDSQSSTYIDGIRDIAAQSREVFDIDSIEVEEGPGGAYGGRGTGGGAIEMNSKLARRDNFIAGSFMPGTADYKRGTVDGNTKLNRVTFGRLTGMWTDTDEAGRDGAHQNRWGVAPSLAIGLGTPTRVILDYYHLVQNNIPDSGIPYNNPSKTPTNDPGPQLFTAGNGEPIKPPYRSIFYGVTDRDHDRDTTKAATGRVEHDLWNGHSLIRNTFRYERTEQDYDWTLPDDSQGNIYYGLLFRRINDRVAAVFTDDDQTDLSGDFKTRSIKHTYATGMEFSEERGNNDAYVNTDEDYSGGTETCPNGAGAASGYNCTSLFTPNDKDPWLNFGPYNTLKLEHAPTHSKSLTKSAYGFDTIVFNKHFQSTVGARYDNYNSTFSSSDYSAPSATYFVENNIGTYLASLVYKPDRVDSIYGTVSTAAIPTGNALAQGVDTSALNSSIDADLQPETIREEEIGAKRELNGGRSLARVDFFREDIQNVRITTADDTVEAAGTDRTYGAEIGISGQIMHNWEFDGGYTYLDAILVNAGGAGTANGITNGEAMPNVAKHSVSITSNYLFFHRLRAGGGIYGSSMIWGSQPNNKWVPGYVREDLLGDYVFSKHFDLQANVLNLSNKLYYSEAYATHYATMAPGRQAIFGINVKF